MLVQFGNNWIQKIPLTAKLDSAYGLVQFWLSSEFFSSNFLQIGQHVVLLHIQILKFVGEDRERGQGEGDRGLPRVSASFASVARSRLSLYPSSKNLTRNIDQFIAYTTLTCSKISDLAMSIFFNTDHYS